MNAFFSKMFRGHRRRLSGDAAWPKGAILAYLRERYASLQPLGDEHGFSLYGVTDNGVQFAVALVLADGAGASVAEVGFIARFAGFPLTDKGLDGINRNLHISVAVADAGGDLYLLGGVMASGDYSDAMFSLVVDAWRRDLLITISALSGGSLLETFPAARLGAVRRFAENRAPPSPEGVAEGAPVAADLLRRFMGAAAPGMTSCGQCGGRGKTGFMARRCDPCAGSGFVKRRG